MKSPSSRRSFLASIFAVGSLIAGQNWSVSAAPLDVTHPQVIAALIAQAKATPTALKVPGVIGTAVGLDANGVPSLVIYVDQDHPNARNAVAPPGAVLEFSEKFRAMVGKPSAGGPGGGGGPAGVSHTASQTPPIQMGTSGGWQKDLANGYCCGGTLGSVIQVGASQYIMSNYHVFEADIVSGGNGTMATTGDSIIQPGLIDVNCNANSAQIVASLVKISSIPANNVDVSVALTSSTAVNGKILEIGSISKTTVGAFLGQAVKKSGRTTGLTRSSVSGLNATISVQYDNECAGGVAFTKTYTGQIVVSNRASKFLNSGDSGSLMVEDVSSNPHAVGLLYAGSSTSAIANPIGEVLNFVGPAVGGPGAVASMVGN